MDNTPSAALDHHYKQQANFKDAFADSQELVAHYQSDDIVSSWRHDRKYAYLEPLIKAYPEASWLTVGDGRFGSDAHALLKRGVKTVMATDISSRTLARAKEDGYITEYQVENAEALSFADNSYDFVVCKESYHHFPRPMIAYYEMLRVARKAVILIEPNDRSSYVFKQPVRVHISRWQALKDFVKDMIGKPRFRFHFYYEGGYEPAGNFIYSVAEREIEKVALGLNHPYVAFGHFNDYYDKESDLQQAKPGVQGFEKVKQELARLDEECRLGRKEPIKIAAYLFKEMPSEGCKKALSQQGVKGYDLPRNPHWNS